MDQTMTILIVLILIALIFMMGSKMYEGFDSTGTEFVPYGAPRYGLRGDLLHTRDISTNYIPKDRLIKLNHGGGMMWEADGKITSTEGCDPVPCPSNTGYYGEGDKCVMCNTGPEKRMEMPGFNYHAKI